jgi:uncharacterized membrane protein
MRQLNRAIPYFLALIFLFSGVDKLLHYNGFLNALRDYVLVPRGAAHLFAPPVILVELAVGIGLLWKPWRGVAALSAAVLLGLFAFLITINHLYGGRGICGCWFTVTLARGTVGHIGQNLLMMFLAASVWWELRQQRILPPMATEIGTS